MAALTFAGLSSMHQWPASASSTTPRTSVHSPVHSHCIRFLIATMPPGDHMTLVSCFARKSTGWPTIVDVGRPRAISEFRWMLR